MIQIVTFWIEGLSPLLMNNPASMQQPGEGTGVKAKKIYDPKVEAKIRLYALTSGQLYLKSAALRSSLIRGGVGKKIGTLGVGTRMAAGVFPVTAECPLVHPKTKRPIKKYTINISRAVIKKKDSIMRARPEIAEWACEFAAKVDSEFVTPEQVCETFNLGGRVAGVGDWRVEKGGTHGRYKATICKATK